MKKRGRPRNTFLSDPDRYVLALAHVLREMGASRRGAVELAVACLEGRVIGPNRPGRGHGLTMLVVRYELPGHTVADGIGDRARWLRRKMKDGVGDAANDRWLAAMSGAWLIALHRGPVRLIRDLAEAVGEAEYAESVLVPVATGRTARRGSEKVRKLNFRPQTSRS